MEPGSESNKNSNYSKGRKGQPKQKSKALDLLDQEYQRNQNRQKDLDSEEERDETVIEERKMIKKKNVKALQSALDRHQDYALYQTPKYQKERSTPKLFKP